MKPILEIKNVSKRFRIRHEKQSYLSLRDSLTSLFKSDTASTEEFYALNDVSFDVFPGDSIGIIGKNGAGKSTLLKILSKITPPSSGKIISRGRIASLLEVGTGFHSELSGRENIYLNGSILGMKRKEIDSKFDEIVDFSGVENFLDTPLKHYSSGMQLRLAFAVAAFLEPEILVIDEVLAVGDAEFQKKCMGKMGEVSKSGRTILFVSHNMGSISHLCPTSILLNGGKVEMNDTSDRIINHYLSSKHNSEENNKFIPDTNTKKEFYFSEIYTANKERQITTHFGFHENINLHVNVCRQKEVNDVLLSIALLDKFGNRVFTILKSLDELEKDGMLSKGILRIPENLIAPNIYSFHFAICKADGTVYDIHEEQCRITVIDTGSEFALFEGRDYGSVIVNCKWN